jgi:DNA (cytosine-5)-methyltransferase 1
LPETPFLTSTNDFDDRNIPVDSPLGTQTTQTKFGITMPAGFVATLRGTAQDQISAASSGLTDTLGTITAGGIHHALVTEAAILNLRDLRKANQLASGLDGVLPTQVCGPQTAIVQRSPFLTSYYGGDQAAGMDEVIDTITTLDRHALCEPGEEIDVDDWYFRMLVPHEIGAGMGFPSDYIVKGNSREKVKQYGNAFTPAVPDLIIRRCIASLHPEVAA